jgi:hypothetical protein
MAQEHQVESSGAAPRAEQRSSPWAAIARGILGGAVGGALGYFAFDWMLTRGYYALVLPGSLVGLGCGLASRRKLIGLGALSAVAALAIGALADWNSLAEPSPTFLEHLATLLRPNRRIPAFLILASVVISFYFGLGRDRR